MNRNGLVARLKAESCGPGMAGVSIEARLRCWGTRVSLLIRRRDVPREASAATASAAHAARPTPR